ncbi:MAG TPA: NADP-dependent oxidoreductase [Planctomycetota bacterium]|nr:NADP-dependent oxidoreductase [Planctomycetota bacterium]
MRAIRVHSFGGPEVLRLDEVPKPVPAEGQVLVRVLATSVNPIDWKLREGMLREIPLPFIPGADFCGTVEGLGPSVTQFKRGDEVFGYVSGGADAEYLVAPESAIAPRPKTLDALQAAAVPLAGLTAWQGLFDHGKLARGENVLILGASGGVGSIAVQLAKDAGAHVAGTAHGDEIELIRKLGADDAIDYGKYRFEDVAKDVDVCLDLVGGDFQRRAFDVVKKGGRLVSTVQSPDEELARARGIEAKMMFTRPRGDELRELAARIDAGKLKISIVTVLPLERASEAEELNRSHRVTGKIVLRVAA